MTRPEILQTAKPILFNTDMVKTIQDGRKTVTRRVSELIRRQPTAYNVDAVVEQLKSEGCILDDAAGNRAVEIIEGGTNAGIRENIAGD